MKKEQLMEAIGGVDENLLMESEQITRRSAKPLKRLILAAAVVAALVVTVMASTDLFSRPIKNGSVVTDGTVAPFEMDADGNIIPGGVTGQKVIMEAEIDVDAPIYLEDMYYLELPEKWEYVGGSGGGDGYHFYGMERKWKVAGKPGWLRLHQSTTDNYVRGAYGKNCVDTLPKLTADDHVSTQLVTVAGIQALKVTIPALPWYNEGNGGEYCAGGETRLYWTDGRYILELDYPYWVSDSEAEALLKTLHTEKFPALTPEGFGTVDAEKIAALTPHFEIEQGNTGTTVANVIMGLGRFAYGDDGIYYGTTGRIYHHNLETGATKTYVLTNKADDPMQLFVTENYICYTDSWSKLVALPKDGSPETILYEGISSGRLYAEGMTIYCSDGIIDMRTGTITPWVEGLILWYVDDTYLYGVEGSESKSFLRINKETMEIERTELTFAPITVLADGDDLYFAASNADKHWQLIRYRDGVETKLPIRAVEYQILDGYVIYRCEDEGGRKIKSYNLETGEVKVIHENSYNCSILEQRYICLYCADDEGQSYCTVLDWQTGEYTELDTHK